MTLLDHPPDFVQLDTGKTLVQRQLDLRLQPELGLSTG
jgi:hypothetical protein